MSFPFAVFDIDGTLIDSRAIISTCMDQAFEGAGLVAPGYEKTRRIVGLSLAQALAQLAPDADAALQARILEAYREIYFKVRQDPAMAAPAYAGAHDLLEALNASGWVLGVATGKSRRGLDAILEQHGWTRTFSTSWCADDGPSKPHPHMVLENLRSVGADAASCIVIGDSEHDMAMARAAQTAALGVSWGFGTPPEMLAAGAFAIVDTMDALSARLAHFAGQLSRKA